jgi:hypothetical protein
VRYKHKIGNSSGIEIVEVLGRQDGDVVVQLSNLDDVEGFYVSAGRVLRNFVQHYRAAAA